MVYSSTEKQFSQLLNRGNGMRLAAEARDRGEHDVAWQHARAYGLNALDLLELGLPEKHRPKGFNPGMPQAMGCV